MVYSYVLGMLLWRRVLDKDCRLISTGWYCIYLHLIRLQQETCIAEIFLNTFWISIRTKVLIIKMQ